MSDPDAAKAVQVTPPPVLVLTLSTFAPSIAELRETLAWVLDAMEPLDPDESLALSIGARLSLTIEQEGS